MSEQQTISIATGPIATGEAPEPPRRSAIATLRRMGQAQAAAAAEHCDLCGAALAPEHPHLLEARARRIVCSCPACALLMQSGGGGAGGGGRFLAVPKDVRRLDDFVLDDAEWRGLQVPIELAFFVKRGGGSPDGGGGGAGGPAAYYPSPAGPTEAAIDLAAWDRLLQRNPDVGNLRPEVEALLVNRLFGQRIYFRVPIDMCFTLVGLVRVHWRGLSGGTEVWKRVHLFFESLSARAGGKVHKPDEEGIANA